MKKPTLPKGTANVLLELGIELLKTLKDLNDKGKLKSHKSKPRKGDKSNVNIANSS
jgi:hypothetical protein